MPTVIKGSGDSTFGGTIQTTGIDDNATSTAITIDSSETVNIGGNVDIFSTTSEAKIVAGTSTSGTKHLYLGSYHGTTLKQLTFSGSNNAFYPQTDNAVDNGLGTRRWKDLYVGGALYVGGSASANALDDYEEGTFTPKWAGSSAGSVDGVGYYTKIGRLINISIRFENNNHSGFTGHYQIKNLPFTSANIGEQDLAIGMIHNINWDTGKWPMLNIAGNASYLNIRQVERNGGWDTLPVDTGSAQYLRTSFSYMTA
jgi:hypothetical protein